MIPFFALAVESGARMWADKVRPSLPRLATVMPWILLLVVGADLTITGRKIFRAAFERKDAAPTEKWLIEGNLKTYPVTFRVRPNCGKDCDPNLFFVANRNFIAVPGDEPTFSRFLWRQGFAGPLRGFNEKGYVGEFSVAGRPIEPSYWTPNRIVFENVWKPIRLNSNPSSYWRINGNNVNSRLSVVEVDREFVVEPDSNGRVVLEIYPKGFWTGIMATFFFVTLLFFFLGWSIFRRCEP